MKRILAVLLSITIITGIVVVFTTSSINPNLALAKESSGTKSEDVSESAAEQVKEKVLNNCGLSDEWLTNIAVYGYVYGDYVYFTKNLLCTDQNIYRININSYKLEKYVKNAYRNAVFQDNFVFYSTFYTDNPKQGLYAKNLDTGKVIKLNNKNNSDMRYVRKFNDKIYCIKDVYDKRALYSINTDGTGKKKIATKILDGKYVFYQNGDEEKLLYIRLKSYNNNEYIKVYSANLDGSNKKLLKKMKYLGDYPHVYLEEVNGDVVLTVENYYRETKEREVTNYLFNGKKFKKIGEPEKNLQYASDILEDGYKYRIQKSRNLDILEHGRGILIERQGLDGEWEVFSSLPFVGNVWNSEIEMHNGYLTIMMSDGDHPYSAVLLDKNGDWLFTRYIAGYTDYTNMHCTVVGNKAYIIHGAVYCDENGNELDKYEVVDLDELRNLYKENYDVTMRDVQDVIVEELKTQGLDYKPGSDNYGRYLDNKMKEIVKEPSKLNKNTFALQMYVLAYSSLFDELLDVIRNEEDDDLFEWEKIDVDEILDNNDCIVYDDETEMYYFELSESFLNMTVKDMITNRAS
ncbi:MAG: DUF5050 domain-containing protein [Lachnospiraceae bacterium]|nr:DUF5050 domain-containing protein [Lachnospiraceae bacterium]